MNDVIRTVTEADREAVVALMREFYATPYTFISKTTFAAKALAAALSGRCRIPTRTRFCALRLKKKTSAP